MIFPFNTRFPLLKTGEQSKLRKFLVLSVAGKMTYTNAKGDSRSPIVIRYPKGAITDLTVWGPIDEGGGKSYHTPLASIEDTQAHIHYRDVDGNKKDTKSDEWVRWAGDSCTAEIAKKKVGQPGLEQYAKDMKAAGGPLRTMTKEDKEAKWTKFKDGKPLSGKV